MKLVDEMLSKIRKRKFIIDRNTCSIYFENIISKNNQVLKFHDPIYHLRQSKAKKK